MHLRSLTLKGFKSFPDRTRLEFDPGVSVIVGPNGSGKSNVTDAVLWVMGEQSPLAVRGRSMQDVIFGGGYGVKARSAAEVEVVLDNDDGTVDLPVGEISIQRRLDRNGDGEYRLNGARCRLVDVLEILSDTGLGREMHSVISQGRIEAIVTSKPRDRRLLIEEAAGLGKHRKRRRRAQIKLERTQVNLDRALDVEHEARSRLKPLKRQAEAAEIHQRLARQEAEIHYELTREQLRARSGELDLAIAAVADARNQRSELQLQIGSARTARVEAEKALAARSEQRERAAMQVERTRSHADRIELRRERVMALGLELANRIERDQNRLETLDRQREIDRADNGGGDRIAALEQELRKLDRDRQVAIARELAQLEHDRRLLVARADQSAATVVALREQVGAADRACELARQERRVAERAAERARGEAAKVGAELASANHFLRSIVGAADVQQTRTLADQLEVEVGYELALSAALGARLSAAVVDDRSSACLLLDRSGSDGGRALIAASANADSACGEDRDLSLCAPVSGARRLSELIGGPEKEVRLARSLLADCWLVDDLDAVDEGFTGVAVTATGRAWRGRLGELVQVTTGGAERVLAVRNRRAALIAESERRLRLEQQAIHAVTIAGNVVTAAEADREARYMQRREAERSDAEAREAADRAGWLLEERRRVPEHGETALRRAQIEGELAAERRVAAQVERGRGERDLQIATLAAEIDRDMGLKPLAERLAETLTIAHAAVIEQLRKLEGRLVDDRAVGEQIAARLRESSQQETELQRAVDAIGETVTRAEVHAQQLRDAVAEAESELQTVAQTLGLVAEPRELQLDRSERERLALRLERITKRRAQIGPVNPLALEEYRQAVAHVEELELQRQDLESALGELQTFVSDTDRQIRATFTATYAATAAGFEELAARLFPGGRGRLTLVQQSGSDDSEVAEGAGDGELAADEQLGVEIEITPAGKSMKRLTLLSGGEKTMTAIAFLFSVFLARPCPFYILDEVEAALDDINITRFLELLRAYSDRAQFIVVTHQKRTMEVADTLYGISMGDNGVSKVLSRRMSAAVLSAREGNADAENDVRRS